jgi:TRAP-type uncharacterized transport system substrate-binding protein
MSRFFLLALAAVTGLVALAIVGIYFYERPTSLRVAVPRGSEFQKLFFALNQEFVRNREDIHLRIVATVDENAAAKAIQDENADLAVVRSDINMPTNAQTALILAHYSAIVATPPGKTFSNFSELNGKTIASIETELSHDANQHLLETIEAQYSMSPHAIKLIATGTAELPKLLREDKIDAILAFGATDAPIISEAVADLANAVSPSKSPEFIPILEANAIAEKFPGLEAKEILRGAFGGSPSRPSENIETIGSTVRLVAQNDLAKSTVSEVTRLILAYRAVAATTIPIANHIEAPSTDKGEVFPTHPGAAAFIDGEEETFFEKYSDMIYIGAMIGSVLVSGIATLASRIAVSGYARFDQLMEQALTILKSGREADDQDTLARLEIQIDEILTKSLAAAEMPKLDSHQLAALTLAVQQARLAISDRRSELNLRQPNPPNNILSMR